MATQYEIRLEEEHWRLLRSVIDNEMEDCSNRARDNTPSATQMYETRAKKLRAILDAAENAVVVY